VGDGSSFPESGLPTVPLFTDSHRFDTLSAETTVTVTALIVFGRSTEKHDSGRKDEPVRPELGVRRHAARFNASANKEIPMRPNIHLRIAITTLLIALLNGCAHQYVPDEYVIAEGRIEPFPISGSIVASSAPDPVRNLRVQVGAHHWDFTNATVAEALAGQVMIEIPKNGRPTGSGGEKTIVISVQSFSVMRGMWTLNGLLGFSVTLGDGTVIRFSVPNNSPGNIWRTLNGTIARGVMEILSHAQVRAYLAS